MPLRCQDSGHRPPKKSDFKSINPNVFVSFMSQNCRSKPFLHSLQTNTQLFHRINKSIPYLFHIKDLNNFPGYWVSYCVLDWNHDPATHLNKILILSSLLFFPTLFSFLSPANKFFIEKMLKRLKNIIYI